MKKIVIGMLIGMVMLMATGCKAEEKEVHDLSIDVNAKEEASEEKVVDVTKIASDLATEISYTDQISEVDLETAKMFLNLADIEVVEACIYESSGATAEEVVVLHCKDSDNASKAKAALEQRVEEQTENFTDYVPEEIPKLKDAVIITSKEYAILSVSADSGKAKDIIEGAFK